MNHADASIKLDCDCLGTCTILAVDFFKYGDEPPEWNWDFYTSSFGYGDSRRFRKRLKLAWDILRGSDHCFHGTVHTVEDMQRLQIFLKETLPDA